jgi:hypothetical protein
MPDNTRAGAGIPAQSRSLLELIDRLREEFPSLSPHTVVRCVSIVAHHPSSAALPVDALVRHAERVARARLTHINDLPALPVRLDPSILTVPQARGAAAASAH